MQFPFQQIYQVFNLFDLKNISSYLNCFYFRGLDSLANDHQHMTFFENVNLSEMVKCLEDLIDYFAQPEENIGIV